jgi:CRISPR/Cas system CMR-associated protein Cmr1 (group 7 of RAMP superfamily)
MNTTSRMQIATVEPTTLHPSITGRVRHWVRAAVTSYVNSYAAQFHAAGTDAPVRPVILVF